MFLDIDNSPRSELARDLERQSKSGGRLQDEALPLVSETARRRCDPTEMRRHLEEDPLTGKVEAFRVECVPCRKWVQLGTCRGPYRYTHWKSHRDRIHGSDGQEYASFLAFIWYAELCEGPPAGRGSVPQINRPIMP